MTDAVLSLLDGIAGLPLWALVVAVALIVAAESSLLIGLIVPGDVAILLAASGSPSAPRAVVLVVAVTAGSVGGEMLGYAIGRRWGGRVRASRLGQALGEQRWDRAGHSLAHHGGRAVFGARYVAAVHTVLPVAAGTLRMPFRKFAIWSVAGALSWATLYVCVGAAAGASFREAGEHLAGATLAVFAVVAVAAAALWLRNRHRRRHAAPASGLSLRDGAGRPGGAGGLGGRAGSDGDTFVAGNRRERCRAGGLGPCGNGSEGVRVASALAPSPAGPSRRLRRLRRLTPRAPEAAHSLR